MHFCSKLRLMLVLNILCLSSCFRSLFLQLRKQKVWDSSVTQREDSAAEDVQTSYAFKCHRKAPECQFDMFNTCKKLFFCLSS